VGGLRGERGNGRRWRERCAGGWSTMLGQNVLPVRIIVTEEVT
jgi:hypothetical protein